MAPQDQVISEQLQQHESFIFSSLNTIRMTSNCSKWIKLTFIRTCHSYSVFKWNVNGGNQFACEQILYPSFFGSLIRPSFLAYYVLICPFAENELALIQNLYLVSFLWPCALPVNGSFGGKPRLLKIFLCFLQLVYEGWKEITIMFQ